MACDPRCLSWFSDDPVNAHDCRDTRGRARLHLPDDPVAEQRRDTALHPTADLDDCPHTWNGTH